MTTDNMLFCPSDRLPDGTLLPDNCVNMGDGLIREYDKSDPQNNAYNLYRIEE